MYRLSVKWEGTFSGSVDSVLRAVVFKACGLPIRCGWQERGKDIRRRSDRLDEPTKLCLGMIASLQSPLLSHLAKSLYLASWLEE
jgi:hypothetical protein